MLNKQELYSSIIHDYPKSETAVIVSTDPDCGYFELCQSFLDIALNAQKIKNQEGGLSGVFQYSDINIAKQKAREFLSAHQIEDVDAFFALLEQQYPLTVSPDEKRQKAGLFHEENCNYVGYAGTFYDFTRISDDVFKKTVEDIKTSLARK